MFIGWIRQNTFFDDLTKLSQDLLLDMNLILNTQTQDQSLAFAAYSADDMVAVITAFVFENSILINNFYYKDDVEDDVKSRLVNILLNNIQDENKTILFMAKQNELDIFKKYKFQDYATFTRAVYGGGAVFNFSSATSKSINNENYQAVMRKLDLKAFKEDRYEYITKDLMKQSSLVLSTDFGYQHSYALNKSVVKISPWIMVDEAFTDAEKLLRGVIYHRGLKKIVSIIPKDVKEIVDLYETYNFEFSDEYHLIYKNTKPDIHLESVYGF